MHRKAAIAFADQLRSGREAALKDAEAFGEIVHAVERLGSFVTGKCTNLGCYKDELTRIATSSALAEEVPAIASGILTPFPRLYQLVKDARNDAVHQGAFARHLTIHSIELALILEDALRDSASPLVSDYMARNPILAETWQPVGFIRQQMLANSFSFLPVLRDGIWHLVSDREVAMFLRSSTGAERKRRLALPLESAQIPFLAADCISEDSPLQDALARFKDRPLLVVDRTGVRGPHRLLGIVTAFDLL